jgi:hypothetical protein
MGAERRRRAAARQVDVVHAYRGTSEILELSHVRA